eukprot:scaffold1199_cov137-Cylindrotheca_fusiformis.AAC.1
MTQYGRSISEKFHENRLTADGDKPNLADWETLLEDDPDFAEEFNLLYNNSDVPEADDEFDPDSFDRYLTMEVAIDRGGEHPELGKGSRIIEGTLSELRIRTQF